MMVAPAARRHRAANARYLNARMPFERPDGRKVAGAFVAGVMARVAVLTPLGPHDILRWRFTRSCRWVSRGCPMRPCAFLTNLTHAITLCKEPGSGNSLGIIVAGG
jgi:hypothetical protein